MTRDTQLQGQRRTHEDSAKKECRTIAIRAHLGHPCNLARAILATRRQCTGEAKTGQSESAEGVGVEEVAKLLWALALLQSEYNDDMTQAVVELPLFF